MNNSSQRTDEDSEALGAPAQGREREAAGSASGQTGLAPVYPSHTLFRGGRQVLIEHGGHQYRLRITRQGKLILTK